MGKNICGKLLTTKYIFYGFITKSAFLTLIFVLKYVKVYRENMDIKNYEYL